MRITSQVNMRVLLGSLIGLLTWTGCIQPNAAAATFYVSPSTGNDMTGSGTREHPWQTIRRATNMMAGGDILLLQDGIYTGPENVISPPPGAPSAYLTIRAEHDGRAILTGWEIAVDLQQTAYVQLEGLSIRDLAGSHAVVIERSHHIKLLRTSIRNGAPWDARYGNVIEIRGGSHHILLEDVWVTGAMRTGVIAYSNTAELPVEKIIVRRAVVRQDGNLEREPKTGMVFYGNTDGEHDGIARDILVQNSLVLDTNRDVPMRTLTDGFANAKQAVNVGYQGSMALNVRSSGFQMSNRRAGRDNWAVDSVVWDCADPEHGKGFYAKHGSGVMRLTRVTVGRCAWDVTDYGDHPPSWAIRDSVFQHITNRDQVARVVDEGNRTNLKPKYLTTQTRGAGADLAFRYGASGTLWGEPGYDQLTTEPLWPWPHEARIAAVFAEPNPPPEGANNTTRGFAGAESLTRYVWEYLGHPCPPSACREAGPARP